MDCPACRLPDLPATCVACVSKRLDPVHDVNQRALYLESLRNRAAVLLANQPNPTSANRNHEQLHLDIAECSSRVRVLAVRKEEAQNRIAERQRQIANRRKFLLHKRQALETAAKRANTFKVRMQHAVSVELATRRDNLQRVHESIMDAWKILVPELFQIFRVEQVFAASPGASPTGLLSPTSVGKARGKPNPAASSVSMEPTWTIVGLKVPLAMDVRDTPQDQLNAALGYTAHLTAILGMYLNVPLPFDLQLRMSATTADLHFRPDRDSLRPFAVPLSSAPSPPPSLSSSISRSFTSRHRAPNKQPQSPSRRHNQGHRPPQRVVPDNLLPIHVGHTEGAERTALGLTMLCYQVTTLAAKCGVKVPTRASKSNRRKLAPLDLVGLLASVAEAVVKDGGPLALQGSPAPLAVLGLSSQSLSASSSTFAAGGGASVRAVSFRTLLAQITRKIYSDENKSGFRIVRPMSEGVAKAGVARRPRNGGVHGMDPGSLAVAELPMSETGVLVPRTPPPSLQAGSGADVAMDEDDEEMDSEDDDDGSDEDDDEDDDDDDDDEAFDPDETILATRLDAGRDAHASFVAIDPASVMVQSIGPGTTGAAANGVLALSSASVGSTGGGGGMARAGNKSSNKARRRAGGGKSSAMARSLMVRSVLAAVEGPRHGAIPSHSMLMRQSMLAAEPVGNPAPSLVLPPQGHIQRPIPSVLGQHAAGNQEQGQSQPVGDASQGQEDDDEWEELDKTITLALPLHLRDQSGNPGDLLNEFAPPMTASVALLAPQPSPVSAQPPSPAENDDDYDLELIEPPSSAPANNNDSTASDAPTSPTAPASSSRVLLSSVWNIGRRALATSYHLAVTAATAGIASGPTSASSAMADAGTRLAPSVATPRMMRSSVIPADALRSRQQPQQQRQREPFGRSATMPATHSLSGQAYTGAPPGLAVSRPLVGRTHAVPGVSGARPPGAATTGSKKRSSGGGSAALTRSAL